MPKYAEVGKTNLASFSVLFFKIRQSGSEIMKKENVPRRRFYDKKGEFLPYNLHVS